MAPDPNMTILVGYLVLMVGVPGALLILLRFLEP